VISVPVSQFASAPVEEFCRFYPLFY